MCYSVHLEVFTGIMGRMKQFADILSHSYNSIATHPYQLIFGDLNTLGHSIARLSRSFCCDDLRWKSIGESESQFWKSHLFSFSIFDGPINRKLMNFCPRYLSPADLASLRNNGFVDPFHVNVTTLQNYKGLFKGKLDWTLCRAFNVCNQGTLNNKYAASDHKLLWLDLMPSIDISDDFTTQQLSQYYKKSAYSRKGTIKIVACLVFLISAVVLAFLENKFI